MENKRLDINKMFEPTEQMECIHKFVVVGYSGNGVHGWNTKICKKCGLVK